MSTDLRIPIAVSARHAHLSQATIERLFGTGLIFDEIAVRIAPDFRLELHLDTDEANAAGVASGDVAELMEAAVTE